MWWKVLIKVWLNILWFFFSDCFSFLSSKNPSCSAYAYSMICSCISILWVSSWVFSIGLIWSYESSKRTDFTYGPWQAILVLGGAVLDVSVFLLKSLGRDKFLWLFWRSCSLAGFFFMNNGPQKGQVSSFPSCCIRNSLSPLLLIPHPIQSSFKYRIDEVLGIW